LRNNLHFAEQFRAIFDFDYVRQIFNEKRICRFAKKILRLQEKALLIFGLKFFAKVAAPRFFSNGF